MFRQKKITQPEIDNEIAIMEREKYAFGRFQLPHERETAKYKAWLKTLDI